MRAVDDLPIDEGMETILVEAPILKWRDKRGDRTPESRLSPNCHSVAFPKIRPSDAAIYGLCSTKKRRGANKPKAWTQHER
jgi:hypothetical protein